MTVWIHHSDQGILPASAAWADRLEPIWTRISLAANGSAGEHGNVKRFFGTFAYEDSSLNQADTFAGAGHKPGHILDDTDADAQPRAQIRERAISRM